MKMIMRIDSLDLYGACGREHHPSEEHVGRYVRILSIEMDDQGIEDALELRLFHAIVVDANGDDIPFELVDVMEYEIETDDDGTPVLYGQSWRDVERPIELVIE